MSSSDIVVAGWGLAEGLPEELAEVLTLGRELAAASGGALRLVALGDVADSVAAEAGSYGAAAIDRIADARLAEFSADAYVAALAAYTNERTPRAVLFAQTFDARLVAPRVAGRIGASVIMNCTEISISGAAATVTAAAFGGDTRRVYEVSGAGTVLFAVNANAVMAEPADGGAASVEEVALDFGEVTERIRVVERPEAAVGPRLEHAQRIVAGGRGLGSADNFKLIEDLAAALEGQAAASRPIVDDGWAKPAQQVGLTGKITKPALYIAVGISGASQHMVGCAAAKTLVAINKDADAAIFRYAHFGIVGDCVEILPEITRAVKAG